MKYHIITYGCQMNKSDSERIARAIEGLGFKRSDSPDLTIINICSVRQSAVDRALSKTKSLKAKTIVTGCILQKDKKVLEKFCDAIFDVNDLAKLPELLKKLGFKIKEGSEEKINHYLQIAPEYQSEITANVPIMTGCNNFCAYCVVPYARGKEISRPAKEIVCEVEALVRRGIKEIWLLGQNVNSYGVQRRTNAEQDAELTLNKNKINFAKLLSMVNDIEGNFWIRFTSSHPKDLTDEMIETIAKCKKITPYFNMPIQSGDDKMLKAMNRPYSVKKYKELIKKTRNAFNKYRKGLEKEIAISTDAIVGFPDETEKQFQNTKQVFKDIKFAFGYISRYSPRPGTASAKLKDNISSDIKKQRERELVKIIEKTALDFNKKFLNKKVEVLILQKKNDLYFGKTRHYQSIKIIANEATNETRPHCGIGKFVKAKVIKATPYGLEGQIK